MAKSGPITPVVRLRELFAGVTTFAAMSYIMFANPAILQDMGMPPGPVFLWTCLTAALASAVAARAVHLPTALACGMGLNVFTVTFAKVQGVPWPPLIATTGVVSVVVLLLSASRFRLRLIDSIPPQIFAAIKGGVGGILTTVAVQQIIDFATDKRWPKGAHGVWWAFGLFALGLLIIIVIKLMHANMVTRTGISETNRRWWNLLDSAGFLISIVILVAFIWFVHRPEAFDPRASLIFSWQAATAAQFNGDYFLKLVTFGIAISFIMLLDIAGSPVDYLKQEFVDPSDVQLPSDKVIRRSLLIDSSFNVLAAAVGVTPVVYYAENHAGWQAGGRTGIVGAIAAVGFFIFAAVGAVCIWQHWSIAQAIPRLAAMPTLFFVGLMLIAGSFVLPTTAIIPTDDVGAPDLQVRANEAAKAIDATATPAQPMVAKTLYFVPAATTTVLASVTLQLDLALAAGIVSYLIISQFPESYLGVLDRRERHLDLVYLAAVIVLLLSLWNYATSVANSAT